MSLSWVSGQSAALPCADRSDCLLFCVGRHAALSGCARCVCQSMTGVVLVSEESLFACDPCVLVICFCHVTCGYLCLPCSGQGFASCGKQPVLSTSPGHGRKRDPY